MATLAVPLIIYGALMFGQKFPKTERVEMGVSYGDMWKAILKPVFLVFIRECQLFLLNQLFKDEIALYLFFCGIMIFFCQAFPC